MDPKPSLRVSDMTMLEEILENEITENERAAFQDMLDGLDHWQILTDAQRKWAKLVHERFKPTYENLVSDGRVPRGREVLEPEALRHRPLKPPGRR
jgi:hypothetical protein